MTIQHRALELMTVAEAAQSLRLSRSTVRRLAHAGAFPLYRTGQRRLGIRVSDIEEYLARREVPLRPVGVDDLRALKGARDVPGSRERST